MKQFKRNTWIGPLFRRVLFKRPLLRRVWVGGIALALLGQTGLAQSEPSPASAQQIELRNEQILLRHYDAAQKFEAANQMDAAAGQYRIFLADALGELAIAEARGDEYDKASAHFDEALSLAPNSPALMVEYAELDYHSGRLQSAEKWAEKIIQSYPKDNHALARAYSVLGRTQLKLGKSADARQSLEKAEALNANFLNGYELAVACLGVEDQGCAEKIFAGMVSTYGDKAILHMFFGQAYMDSDFQSKAVGEFQDAIAIDSKFPGAHYSLAAAYLVTGQHVPEAEDQLQQEIAIYPKEAMAHAALGHLEAGQHKDADAEKELQTAAALAPDDPDAFLYLGQLYASQQEDAKAETALQKSIALTTDISRNHYQVQKAHYLLGRLLLKDGNQAEAQKQLQISQSMMNQNLSRAREQLANYYNQGAGSTKSGNAPPVANTDAMETRASELSAQAAAEFAERVGPSIANSYNNLGVAAGSAGDAEQAYEDFSHAEEWDMTIPGLDENLGRAAFSSYHFAEAVTPLTGYVSRHPDDETMRAALGVSLYMTNQYAKAQVTLEPMMQSSGITDEIAYIYAECLVKTGHAEEGITRLKALTAKLPQEESLRRSLGEAYAASGDSSHAVAELQAAEKLDGKDAEVHLDLAEAYKKLGRRQDAAHEMQQYQSLKSAGAGTK